MDDTIAWLKAQIDEDEAMARGAACWYGDSNVAGLAPNWREVQVGHVWNDQDGGIVDADNVAALPHIVRHDPARVLREVEAKRRIITEWEEAHRMAEADPTDVSARVARFSFTIALQALYGVYSDRPGWIEAWSL